MAKTTQNPRIKEFQWCGLTWRTAMESDRPIAPSNPWYYYDGAQVYLDRSDIIHLSISRYPRTIKWFDSSWDKKVDYHPTIACGVIRSVDTVPVNSVIECEVKMPKGVNLWPSFWMTACDAWPPEIDIFEGYTNRKGSYKDGIGLHRTFPFIYREIRMESNVHYKGANGEHLWAGAQALNKKYLKMPLEGNWNHFRCEWREDSIRFYANGKLTRTVTDEFLLSKMKTEGMWVIFNVWPNDRFNLEEDGDITAFKQCYSIRNFKITPIK